MKKARVFLCVLMALLTCLSNLGTIYASNANSGTVAAPIAESTSIAAPTGLKVKIGNLSGNIGDTVTVPITFQNLKTSINNCDFALSYDSSAVELTTVEAGSIVTNPTVNFTSNITSGKVVIFFTDMTQGNQPITKDGVFANLTFKIKSLSNSKIFLDSIPVFSDTGLFAIDVTFVDDTGIIMPTPTPTPTPDIGISPTPDISVSPTPDIRISPTPDIRISPTPDIRVSPTPDIRISPTPDIRVSPTPDIRISPTPDIRVSPTPDIRISPTPDIRVSPTPDIRISPTPCKNLTVTIGNISGNIGDTVTVPVTFYNLKENLNNCDFALSYDSSAVELISVEAGSIVTNPSVNFASSINSGKVVLLFCDETVGNAPITKDGVFANLTFKIKSLSILKIFLKSIGVFSDTELNDIGVTFIDDTGIITPIPTPTPVIPTPTSRVSPTPTPTISPTPTPTPTIPVVSPNLTVTIGNISGNIGDTVTVPVTFHNLKTDLNNCDFALSYDSSAVELTSVEAGSIVTNPTVNFTSNITSGKVEILFVDETQVNQPITKDGIFANLVFKIKSGTSKISLAKIGSFNTTDLKDIAVTFAYDTGINTPTPTPAAYTNFKVRIGNDGGCFGDTVTIPVMFEHLNTKLNNCDFALTYDSTAVELIDVNAGSIVTNPSVNFASSINPGKVILLFQDETQGNCPITKDGVFANLIFKIKSGSSRISLASIGSFSDNNLNDIPVTFADGVLFAATPTPPPPSPNFRVLIGSKVGIGGDTITVPIVFQQLNAKLNNCDFTLKYDSNAAELISVDAGSIVTNPSVNFYSYITPGKVAILFEDDTEGSAPITKDGVFANLVFKVKSSSSKISLEKLGSFNDTNLNDITPTFEDGLVAGNTPSPLPIQTPTPAPKTPSPLPTPTSTPIPLPVSFAVAIGNVSGCPGDTVTVPVMFEHLNTKLNNCDFTLKYDANAVDLTSVKAGSIVTNPEVNFYSNIVSGKVAILFVDQTQCSEPITKDGVFAYLTFKIKSSTPSKISLLEVGSFNDSDLNDICTKFTDGSILISTLSTPVPSMTPTPTPTPTPSVTPTPTPTPTPSVTPTPTPTIVPSLSPSMIKVDTGYLKDINVNIGTNKLANIKNGDSALTQNDYTVSGNIITISKWYLNYYFYKFPDQNLYLNFNFANETSSVLTVYKGSTPFVSMTDSISYRVNSGDVQLSLILNGNFITGVKNGNKSLTSRIDYTYDPSKQIFYIRKGYLNSYFSQTSQPLKLIVNFTGDSKTVVIYPIPEN